MDSINYFLFDLIQFNDIGWLWFLFCEILVWQIKINENEEGMKDINIYIYVNDGLILH